MVCACFSWEYRENKQAIQILLPGQFILLLSVALDIVATDKVCSDEVFLSVA